MKKALLVIVALIIVFLTLLYISLNSKPEIVKRSILVNIENINSIDFRTYDSVIIKATTQYKSTEFKELMQGKHYRNAWSAPVKVPVLYIDTLYGGLTVTKEGGGKQTRSLKLKDSNGIYYTLRSINKNPDALIPEFAKTLGLENIVIDGISAQHPYGALVAAKLAETANILHTFPKVVFIPKQDALDQYNNTYGNRLYLFEYETESDKNWTHYTNVVSIIDTDDLQEKKQSEKHNLKIDKNALVRARLFDLVIGDWDRHAKQWGWIIQEQDGYLNAIPLPVDRDNAFFNAEGLIPNLIANRNVMPEVQAFEKDIDYLPGLVQPFDIYFLHNTPESVFIEEARNLQNLLTDEAIDEALRAWPQNIYVLDAQSISKKLKSRRNDLWAYAKGFKKELDKKALLTEPLKGSEDLQLPINLLSCFECDTPQ